MLKKVLISSKLSVIFVLFLLFLFPGPGLAQNPDIKWVEGPSTVDLGTDLAQLKLNEAYIFANGADTIKIMESLGNPPSNEEVGLVAPKDEKADWYLVFEYSDVGYVKDDEKDSIDAAAILESIKEGTEEANKIRAEQKISPIKVVGWYEEPRYDANSHNLVWAVLGESDGHQIINYNVRLLGRTGYMSAVLVTDPETLNTYKPELENVLTNFSYKQGKSYAEWLPGDKVAEIGLTALVAGGAGAVAAKTGFFKVLAKFGKFIFVAVLAFLAAIWKFFKSFFGRSDAKSSTP